MSTNSTIVVEIPISKRGKKYQYEKTNLDEYDTPPVVISNDANYAEIYVHWDGYENGVGRDLITALDDFDLYRKEYKDCEDKFDYIMKYIIASGDKSSFDKPYHAWRNEDWSEVCPSFLTNIPDLCYDYQYLIYNEKNKWKIKVRDIENNTFHDLIID